MDSQRESELLEEIAYLEDKCAIYGWSQGDRDKYNELKKLLGID